MSAADRLRVLVTLCVECNRAIHDCECEPDGGPEPPTVRVWMTADADA